MIHKVNTGKELISIMKDVKEYDIIIFDETYSFTKNDVYRLEELAEWLDLKSKDKEIKK